MARLLYWSIDNFSIAKLQNVQGGNSSLESALTQEVITAVLTSQTPDIIVVLDTQTGQGNPGTLINGPGEQGAQGLLKLIRATKGDSWSMVPSLRLGEGYMQRGALIFYNTTTLEFTGPWGWFGSDAGAITTQNASQLRPYQSSNLPTGTVNQNSPYNEGRDFNQLAGQWEFSIPVEGQSGLTQTLGFPNSYDRAPFLVTFWDNTTSKAIKLLAYQAPEQPAAALMALDRLSKIQELTPNDNETVVVAGNFNVDLLGESAAYKPLLDLNFESGLPIPATNPSWPVKGYYGTTIQPEQDAVYVQDKEQYPGGAGEGSSFQGYMNNTDELSIDNVFVKSSSPVSKNNFTILNGIVGSPYLETTAGVPTGTLAFPPIMTNTFGNFSSDTHLKSSPDPTELNLFRSWNNYDKIVQTSSHLPLVLDL